MILDKVLILKGLGGITALGGTIAAAWYGISSLGGDSDAKELKKSLGLPEDDNVCKLPTTNNSPTNCKLDTDKLKEIKFEGKTDTTSPITVTGTLNLKITKTSDTTTYPQGYKFTFENENDLSIPKTSSTDVISIKKGTNTEFKIKETTAEGGAKTLALEKVWTVTEWGKKVGLTCPSSGNSTKECTLPTDHNLNVAFSSNDKSTTTIKDDSRNKKIKYEGDSANHNQGFKFYIDSSGQEISLNDGNKKIEKNNSNGSPTYEIKEIEGKWYLAKKETTNGVGS